MGDNNDAFMRNQNAAVRGTTKGQNRANVLQLKLIGQSHPTGLTTNLLKLFEPRLPLEFKPPPEKRKCPPYSGMAQFVSNFAEPGDLEYAPPIKEAETRVEFSTYHICSILFFVVFNYNPLVSDILTMFIYLWFMQGPIIVSYVLCLVSFLSLSSFVLYFITLRVHFHGLQSQRKARIHMARLEKGAEKAAEELQKYDPNNDPKVSGDPYKTLFVARLSYETTESKIKRELESYGPIKQVCMVADKVSNKPRGYAFIEYMHTRDMKAAYKQADGRKLDGRRVLVDVERGRTVPNWRPRRLGGGLGTTRVGGEEVNQRHPGREVQQSGGLSRSEEPRTREDRHTEREREVSRDRGRDKDKEREREKSHERSHDRPRDRDHREDRHNRDRERERDRGRDRDRTRDRGRDRGRDYERDRERDHGRDRARDRERDYEVGDHYHGRSHDRDESKHERDRHGERDNDHAEPEDDMGWYEQPEQGQKLPDAEDDQHYDHYEHRRSRGRYDHMDVQGDHGRSDLYHGTNRDGDHMEEDDYHYDRGTSESRENRRLERSPSQD